MIIEKREKYTLVTPDENSFAAFYKACQNKKNSFKNKNIIIVVPDTFDQKNKDISSFLVYAEKKKENGTSFIVVDHTAKIEDFPETFNIAPTLQEAEDILEMEIIERELGF